MHLRIAGRPVLLALMLAVLCELVLGPACTFYGEHPARTWSEATGGEGLERVFWKEVAARNWVEVERALASNYVGVTPGGTLDREATLAQYRQWQLKSYSLGDVKTEMNGSTVVVTYTIALSGTLSGTAANGTAGSGAADSQPLPSAPQRMMTVWQQQKNGWVAITHSVSQP
ncbi:MAG: nuclear transport factor 2 family protein [Terriglobales bacterium]|jgi:hypothetical protein